MISLIPPAVSVLGDAFLFRRITAFQFGMEMALLTLWHTHNGADVPFRLDYESGHALVELLVKHGSLRLLRMAERAQFCSTSVGAFRMDKLPLRLVADLALKDNRVDIVEWALASKHSRISNRVDAWSTAVERASEDGDMRVLKILHKFAPPKSHLNRVASCIPSDLRYLEVLRFVVDALPKVRATFSMMTLAAAQGDLPLLQRLRGRGLVASRDSHIRIDAALSAGHVDVLEFLFQHFWEHLERRDVLQLAASTDPAIQALALRLAPKLQGSCRSYIDKPDFSDLGRFQQWVATGILSPRWPILIDTIVLHGRLDVVRLLHEHGIATASTEAMDQAAEKATGTSSSFSISIASKGVRRGRWTQLSSRATSMMDAAAKQGNLAGVKFLHENRSEGCTTAAMSSAAANGHLSVVEYMHAQRTEGCTLAALSGAIQAGRLNVVRFLFRNYRRLFDQFESDQDLVTETVKWVLSMNKERGVVGFLFDHFPHSFSPDLLHDMLAHGMFDMYRDLRSRFPDDMLHGDIKTA